MTNTTLDLAGAVTVNCWKKSNRGKIVTQILEGTAPAPLAASKQNGL